MNVYQALEYSFRTGEPVQSDAWLNDDYIVYKDGVWLGKDGKPVHADWIISFINSPNAKYRIYRPSVDVFEAFRELIINGKQIAKRGWAEDAFYWYDKSTKSIRDEEDNRVEKAIGFHLADGEHKQWYVYD